MLERANKCTFYQELDKLKDDGQYYKKQRHSRIEYTSECKLTIVVEDYYDDNGKKECGGRVVHQPRIFNFCPECGRKIEAEETAW